MILIGSLRRVHTVMVTGAAVAVLLFAGPAMAHETHEVEPGDSLSELAADFGVTVDQLMEENDLSSPDRIRIGQLLSIPHPLGATSPGSTDRPRAAEYTVAPGDTLGHIALRLGVRGPDLVAANNLADPDRIRIGQRLTIPGGGISPHQTRHYPDLPQWLAENPERLALIPAFERWSEANGLPADLVMALAWQESGWNPAAVSHKGAVGVGQIMPATGEWVATDLIGRPELDTTIAEDNIRISVRYLRWLIDYLGTEELALAGYYQGPGAVRAGIMYLDTEQYVASVVAHRRFFVSS